MKIKNLVFALAAGSIVATSCTPPKADNAFDGQLKTQNDSLSYALGLQYGNQLEKSDFDQINGDVFAAAVKDIRSGESDSLLPLNLISSNEFIQGYVTEMNDRKNLVYKEEGEKFLLENGAREGVITTESGLQYEVVTMGTGDKPTAEDKVKVHYHGTLIDGTVFDSSVDRGQPIDFPLNGVIKGWTEGVQLMPVGSKFKFYIPQELAYGANVRPGGAIKPYMTLIFDVELLDIIKE